MASPPFPQNAGDRKTSFVPLYPRPEKPVNHGQNAKHGQRMRYPLKTRDRRSAALSVTGSFATAIRAQRSPLRHGFAVPHFLWLLRLILSNCPPDSLTPGGRGKFSTALQGCTNLLALPPGELAFAKQMTERAPFRPYRGHKGSDFEGCVS